MIDSKVNGKPGVVKVSELIRSRRNELSLTQQEVAEKVGVKSGEYISLVESGVRNLDLDRIPRLAEALRVNSAMLARMALAEQYPLLAASLEKPKRGARPNLSATEESILHKLKELPYQAQQLVANTVDVLHHQCTPSTRSRIHAA
jgi:transcriptional regulator with XRE-family HTH domain